MRMLFIQLFLFLFFVFQSQAQEKWNLKTCVEYAVTNNVSVRQSDVQTKLSAITYQQSKYGQLPTANFGFSSAFNSGNNQDPTTFSKVTENYISAGMQLQSSADIFNFFSKRATIVSNYWELMAAQANVNKLKSDIALSTANSYLQILLAKEQEHIAAVQIQQTQFQLDNTRKSVEAGSLPELNALQLEAQLAIDSGNYISANGNTQQAVLALKSLMNIDAAAPFEIETPPVASIPVELIADLQPEYVYQQALINQPQQIYNAFKLKAAEKAKVAAKASMYPSLTAFGNFSSNYLSFSKRPYYSKVLSGYQSTGLLADAGNGIYYDVQSPVYANGAVAGYIKPNAFGTQLSDNLRKSLGISINVPLFNGGLAKANFERSKLNFTMIELQKEKDNSKLKQDIYQAYSSALVALEKFNASKKSVEANEKSFQFAGKRFNIGALSMYDWISAQNNLLRAKLEYAINEFDYVFKMKVLEFYKGAGLKL